MPAAVHELLKIGPHISALPIIHGSGDFALEVRRVMLAERFDCVAVPLPPSFQSDVEEAIERLPAPSLVIQRESMISPALEEWSPEKNTIWDEDDDDDWDDWDGDDGPSVSYVPIDPCQGVVMALRIAMGEHIRREYIDLETARFQPDYDFFPDPYALKKVALHRFAAAVLPALDRPEGQTRLRVEQMASRLRELERKYESILLVCSLADWPWIREAWHTRPAPPPGDLVAETEILQPDPRSLIFMLGELPFVTGLYERARAELEDDDNLSIDGVKELLIAARTAYRADLRNRARRITPHLLTQCLKYVRNLSLIERRMSPDLYSLVMAAKQVAGDQYALHVAETARDYPYCRDLGLGTVTMGIDRGRLPEGDEVDMVNRLPGPPVEWRACELQRRPDPREVKDWSIRWNPYDQCSYPPEDDLIENFRSHLFDRAKAIMGTDLVRTEKFTTSVKDGIDIRDTLRHWYSGELYVKVLPPARGRLDCAVTFFDSPADPRDYPWRTTWFAEHENESTLAFFATDFHQELVGPGIGLATYGGALFLFPPIAIPDIWADPRLDFTETMEERILAAACLHASCPHIALLSSQPPGAGWRRLARRFGKSLVHIPLGQFSESTIQQLRMVHVLNGKDVRSYAAHFIRRA